MNIAWVDDNHRNTTLREVQQPLDVVGPDLDSSAYGMRVPSEPTATQMHLWDSSSAIDLILRS